MTDMWMLYNKTNTNNEGKTRVKNRILSTSFWGLGKNHKSIKWQHCRYKTKMQKPKENNK